MRQMTRVRTGHVMDMAMAPAAMVAIAAASDGNENNGLALPRVWARRMVEGRPSWLFLRLRARGSDRCKAFCEFILEWSLKAQC